MELNSQELPGFSSSRLFFFHQLSSLNLSHHRWVGMKKETQVFSKPEVELHLTVSAVDGYAQCWFSACLRLV